MATRRSRIKGIANIPQRKKNEIKLTEEIVNADLLQKPIDTNADKSNLLENGSKEDDVTSIKTNHDTIKQPENTPVVVNQPHKVESSNNTPETQVVINDITEQSLAKEIAINAAAINFDNCVKADSAISQKRTFIKPLVNSRVLSQKVRLKSDHSKLEQIQSKTEFNQISVSNNSKSETHNLSKEEGTLNSTQSISNAKINIDSDSTSESNTTKSINRSRIKAIPRLGQRRTSTSVYGSASESEDDSKKIYKRIRTESGCSFVSATNEPTARTDPDISKKKERCIVKRKCKRSELSRRMAEARRHFLYKNGKKPTDKQKLTMFDLIVYNPNTAPMSQKPKKQETNNVTENLASPENPIQTESPTHSDDENTVPAPQIKIGANGEIVIDEQSLIIENAQTKKSRENIQKSALIDGDSDMRYGFYIKEKRAQEWSDEETVRFYKALNTLGTDFATMMQLFSGRNRGELKKKFKKEERINRRLIEKALRTPTEYNIRELKREAEELQKKAEMEKLKKAKFEAEWATKNKDKVIPYTYSGAKRKSRESTQAQRTKTKKRVDLYGKIEKGIACVWESESEDESENSLTTPNDSLSNILKPTRCGRVPKPTKVFDYEAATALSKPEADSKKLEPGSLMIIYKESHTGTPAFDVFMVTPSQNKVPIMLTPDIVSNISRTVDNSNTPIENNYTIVHTDVSEKTADIITEYREGEVGNLNEKEIAENEQSLSNVNNSNKTLANENDQSGDNGFLTNSEGSETCQQQNNNSST